MSSQWFRFSESWVAERCAASYAPKHLRSRPRMALFFKRTALAPLRGGTGWDYSAQKLRIYDIY
jgi:hypothetical protein